MKKTSIAELLYANLWKFASRFNKDFIQNFEPRMLLVAMFTTFAMAVGWLIEVVNIKPLALMLFGFNFGLSLAVLSLKIIIRLATTNRKHAPSLKRISNFADFWGLGLRKRIKAVAGEFDVELKRLHKEKRYGMAKWNVILAWGYAIWYVLRGPYDMLKGALVKALRGL